MKQVPLHRLLSLLTAAALMILCTVSAFAEPIDLTAMPDNELIELLDQVNQAIAARGIQKTAKLAKGTYIAGQDIPVGTYVFTCLATGNDWGNVTVYSDGGDGKQLLWEVVSAPDEDEEAETIYVKLNEGDQLASGVPFSLTIAGGIRFQ